LLLLRCTTDHTHNPATRTRNKFRNRARNRSRAGAFRRWLIDTYGHERLASGTGILDVAGGKGELAWELSCLSGLRATLVDPRKPELERYLRKLK
jgi:ubiquinone/menaquinone biosynthesis C-methylase UbiE